MRQRCMSAVLFVLGVTQLPIAASAQTTTYHLHKESSKTTGLLQLKTAGPDSATATLSSVDMKNQPAGEYLVKAFDTAAGVPNASGTIPAGSIVSATLWMKKSAKAAAIYPRAKLRLNSATGASLCVATGVDALTTTLTAYRLSCTTSASVTMTAADRFYLWVGMNVVTAAGTSSVKGQLAIEGALNGNYDSQVVAPLPILTPAITSLAPSSGVVGTAIAITGSNFGSTQGASQVTFNGVAATATSWTAARITAPVPAGATTGPVVVRVSGLASNGATFTVIELGAIRGQVVQAGAGAPISGATVTAASGTATVATSTTATGTYALENLQAGTYAVTAAADGYRGASEPAVSVFDGATTTRNFALERGSVTYAYDELDRLVAVVDQNGAGASYRYDAVGNVLSIDRHDPDSVSILGFAPARGAAGTAVTITGTSFSTTPADNAVRFDGSPATITSAAATQIVATVPSGAASGPIVVVTPSGTATSGSPFTVVADGAAPTITAFTPALTVAGTSIQISGSNFDPAPGNTRVRQNVTFVSPMSVRSDTIEATLPPTATSGHLSVRTPDGFAASPDILFVAPAPFHVDDVGFTAATTIGQTIAVPVSSEKISVIAFDAVAGQRVALRLPGNAFKRVLDPVGGEIAGFWTFLDTRVLPMDGTYTVVQYACYYDCVTAHDLTVYDVPPDATASVAVDDPPVSFDVTSIGQQMRLTFTGAAGQHVAAVMVSGAPDCCVYASLTSPSGRDLLDEWTYFDVNTPVDAVLPESGLYSFVFNPHGSFATGHFTIALRNIEDTFVTAEVDGPAVVATTTQPMQDIYASFAGTAGALLMLRFTDVTLPEWSSVVLRNPDGTILLEYPLGTGEEPYGSLIELPPLPQTGTYTLFIDVNPFGDGGSVTLRVTTPPPDVTGEVEVGGPPLTLTIPAPGQNAIVTFTGTAGMSVTVSLTDVAFQAYFSLADQDGHVLNGGYTSPGLPTSFDVTLPTSGPYTLFIDPVRAATGSITVAVGIATP